MEKQYGRVYIKKPKSLGGNWDDKKKVEVVSTWLQTGNLSLTGRLCEVPYPTLEVWRRADWWKKMAEEINTARKTDQKSKISKIAEKAMEVVMDRLENGNFQYDQKTGQILRVPVNARDAARITGDMIDREAMIDKQIRALQVQEERSTKDQLKDLADAFSKLANTANKLVASSEENIIDVTPPEAEDN